MHFPISYLQKILRICENSKTGLRWNEIENDEKWNKKYANKEAGLISVSGSGRPAWRVYIPKIGKSYYTHRIIKCLILKRHLKKGEMIDHKDNNPLNNKTKNLRLVNSNQNNYNVAKNKRNKTGQKNISILKNGKFCVRIKANGKSIYGGVFKSEIDAIKKAKELRKKHHGRFANHGNNKN